MNCLWLGVFICSVLNPANMLMLETLEDGSAKGALLEGPKPEPLFFNDFRIRVLWRPTPPKSVNLPEITDMRLGADNPRVQEKSCASLTEKLLVEPELQEPIIMQEAHIYAIKAMNQFPNDQEV